MNFKIIALNTQEGSSCPVFHVVRQIPNNHHLSHGLEKKVGICWTADPLYISFVGVFKSDEFSRLSEEGFRVVHLHRQFFEVNMHWVVSMAD